MVALTKLVVLLAGACGAQGLQPTFDSGRETVPGAFIFEFEDGYVSRGTTVVLQYRLIAL